MKKILLHIFFAIYLFTLTFLILFKGSVTEITSFVQLVFTNQSLPMRDHNAVLFSSIAFFFQNWEYSWARLNVYINIVAFLPMGWFVAYKKQKMKYVLSSFQYAFWTSLMFEYIQFYYNIGEFDVDDIFLNVCGSIIGFIMIIWSRNVYMRLKKSKRQREIEKQQLYMSQLREKQNNIMFLMQEIKLNIEKSIQKKGVQVEYLEEVQRLLKTCDQYLCEPDIENFQNNELIQDIILECNKRGIHTDIKIQLFENRSIREVDLVSLIKNLLEFALINNKESSRARFIRAYTQEQSGVWAIKVVTSKDAPNCKGKLKKINKIVRKYHGVMNSKEDISEMSVIVSFNMECPSEKIRKARSLKALRREIQEQYIGISREYTNRLKGVRHDLANYLVALRYACENNSSDYVFYQDKLMEQLGEYL